MEKTTMSVQELSGHPHRYKDSDSRRSFLCVAAQCFRPTAVSIAESRMRGGEEKCTWMR